MAHKSPSKTAEKLETKVTEKLEEQITCPICLEHLTNPKVLACFHSFCLHCLESVPVVLVNGAQAVPCPTCRSPCPVPPDGLASLPPSFVINNLMEVYELMKKISDHQHTSCDNCNNTNADRYCKQCAKFLCPQCLHHHDNWKPNVSHQTISLDEVASHCISILNCEGKKIRSFGTCGIKKGQFKYPAGVAITSKRTILVADGGNHRIQEFTVKGGCISRVGTIGSGPQQFNFLCGIAINKATRQVFVAERLNNRVQVFHPNLTFSHMFGSEGSEQGQFKHPYDVIIDNQGFVHVADKNNHRVQKFTPDGQFVSLFGTKGSEPGQLRNPSAITTDDNDLLYINNDGNQYITVCTTNGQYISSIDKKSKKESNRLLFSGIFFDSKGNFLACSPQENLLLLF